MLWPFVRPGMVRLVGYSAEKYRSIIRTEHIAVGDRTVFVGPNNRGKSNLLRGLAMTLTVLAEGWEAIDGEEFDYKWDRDFPVGLQQAEPDGASKFVLDFDLNASERRTLKRKLGRHVDRRLRVGFWLKREFRKSSFKFRFSEKEAWTSTKDPHDRIAAMQIRAWLDFEYIPSKRSAEASEDLVRKLVSLELAHLQHDPAYRAATESVREIESRVLRGFAERITPTVRQFLPDLKEVRLESRARRSGSVPNIRVVIDDGAATALQQKGDGVQSLVTLALARHTKIQSSAKLSLILAVEEPETHLHPDAVHGLRSILSGLSEEHQLLMTTHSPLLVDREEIQNNVLVGDGTVVKADSVEDIRRALGTRVSDNLASANLVILVEGSTDTSLVKTWLSALSPLVGAALADGSTAIERMGGAGNVENHARMYRSLLCDVHVLVDNDQSGIDAVNNAVSTGALQSNEYNILVARGLKESVIEDLIRPGVYEAELRSRYGVDIRKPEFTKSRGKWSKRMEATFRSCGKRWSLHEPEVKSLVGVLAVQAGLDSLAPTHRPLMRTVARTIEARIAKT